MTSNPRVVVAQLLNDCLQQKTPLHYLMAQKKIENPTLPWPYIQALCFGVMRMYPRLYWLIHQYLAKPIKKKEALLEQLIIAGCYELLEMNTPDYAVIKETVFACDVLQKPWAKSLCNAVLRKVQEAIQTNTLCFDKDITAKTAHPKWLLGMLKKAWPSDWQTIVEANNIPPPLTIRINQKLITREKYQSILQEKNLSATPLSAPESLMVYPAVDIAKLPYFDKGMVSIQDGAAQFSPHLLDLKPKLQVLDACAAPGGKTCHILECEPLLDTLIAIERYAHRAAFITENLARLRLKADIVIADATEPLP